MGAYEGFAIRAASMGDAAEITDLVIACDIADFGQPDFVLEDLLDIFGSLNLEKDTWVVRDGERIVGFGFVEVSGEGALTAMGYVHPECMGRGAGTELVRRIEERAKEVALGRPEQSWVLSQVVPAKNEAAQGIMEGCGYAFKRLYSRMLIDLVEEPVVRPPSEGLKVRPFAAGMEQAMYAVYREAFRDTNRFIDVGYEEWMEAKSGEHYERDLWFTAWDGEALAGFAVSKKYQDHVFVDLVGVRRAWRKHGVASSLLQHVFRAAYGKGIRNVRLSVDAESMTGANRLYEALGMRAAFQQGLWEKGV